MARHSISSAKAWQKPGRSRARSGSRRNWLPKKFRGIPMPITDRRPLLQAAAALPLAAAATTTAFAQAPGAASAAAAPAAPAKDVTRSLAHYLVTASYDDLPANVRK